MSLLRVLATVTIVVLRCDLAGCYTYPGDIASLKKLRDGLGNGKVVFNDTNWRDGTDPCEDRWLGIFCDCHELSVECLATSDAASDADCIGEENSRVTYLDFGVTVEDRIMLTGTIPAAIGDLSGLKGINLLGNQLQGTLPRTLSNLKSLEVLNVYKNNLTGPLPDYLPALENLTVASFGANNFFGTIPVNWTNYYCSSYSSMPPNIAATRIDVTNNEDLCGYVNSTLLSTLSFSGTRLVPPNTFKACFDYNIDPDEVSIFWTDYCCPEDPSQAEDTGVPYCKEGECGVTVPTYWTQNSSTVTFNFTTFQGAKYVYYEWIYTEATGSIFQMSWQCVPLLPSDGEDCFKACAPREGYVYREVDGHLQNFSQSAYWIVSASNNEFALVNGVTYQVTVRAVSLECPGASVYSTSRNVTAVFDPPTRQGMPTFQAITPSKKGAGYFDVRGKVAPFTDDLFTACNTTQCEYWWQLVQVDPEQPVQLHNSTPSGWVKLGQYNDFHGSLIADEVELRPGHKYRIVVNATNAAGLSSTSLSDSELTPTSTTDVVRTLLVIVLATLAGMVVVLGPIIFLLFRHQQLKLRRRKCVENLAMLRDTMDKHVLPDDTVDHSHNTTCHVKRSELAFVITDLENSTAMASKDQQAYRIVQELHDNIMRQQIARCNGYEINTEGDSFHIAFASVAAAVQFCMGVQYDLLEVAWPHRVLKLPSCKKETTHGYLTFCGPRVRMGINWAVKGSFGSRQHRLTKTWVFSGPGFMMAHEIGDAAHGGQVVLTDAAWAQLRCHMANAAFPIVKQLGLFKLESSPSPVWLYEVSQLVGRPLNRNLGLPRDLQVLQEGWSHYITSPPRRSSQGLCFVCIVLGDAYGVAPSWLSRRLHSLVQVMVMQYQGYIFKANMQRCMFEVAFPDTVCGLFCCHSLQISLMVEAWPRESMVVMGPWQDGLDGKPLWGGPRCAMSIHKTNEFKELKLPDNPKCHMMSCSARTYVGTGVDFTAAVASVSWGGQVVLSEEAWSEVHSTLPGGKLALMQCLHLGVHVINSAFQAPVSLMEVMPAPIIRRNFEALKSEAMLSPGYRESPDPEKDMAIVFVAIAKPHEVVEAHRMSSSISDADIMSVITLYLKQVHMVEEMMRHTLHKYGGYECKEPEPGKFTLAFSSLSSAIECCVALQLSLLYADWPPEVLTWEECKPVTGLCNAYLWRGLRLRMGCAYGKPDHRKPLHTGRADYYGSLANLAARVCALAKPGQLLVEASGTQQFSSGKVGLVGLSDDSGSAPSRSGPSHTRTTSSANLRAPYKTRMLNKDHNDLPDIELRPLGPFKMKGFDDERWIYCAFPAQLADRYPPPHNPSSRSTSSKRPPREGSFRHIFKQWSGSFPGRISSSCLPRVHSWKARKRGAPRDLDDLAEEDGPNSVGVSFNVGRSRSGSAVAQVAALRRNMVVTRVGCLTEDVGEVNAEAIDDDLERCYSIDLGALAFAHQRLWRRASIKSMPTMPAFDAVSHLSAVDAMLALRRVHSCPDMLAGRSDYADVSAQDVWVGDTSFKLDKVLEDKQPYKTQSGQSSDRGSSQLTMRAGSLQRRTSTGGSARSLMGRPSVLAQMMDTTASPPLSPTYQGNYLAIPMPAGSPEVGDSLRSGCSALELLSPRSAFREATGSEVSSSLGTHEPGNSHRSASSALDVLAAVRDSGVLQGTATSRSTEAPLPEAGNSHRSGLSSVNVIPHTMADKLGALAGAVTVQEGSFESRQKTPFADFSLGPGPGPVELSDPSMGTAQAQHMASMFVLTRRATMKSMNLSTDTLRNAHTNNLLSADTAMMLPQLQQEASWHVAETADSTGLSVHSASLEDCELHPVMYHLLSPTTRVQHVGWSLSKRSSVLSAKSSGDVDKQSGITTIHKTRQLIAARKLNVPPSLFGADNVSAWDDREAKH